MIIIVFQYITRESGQIAFPTLSMKCSEERDTITGHRDHRGPLQHALIRDILEMVSPQWCCPFFYNGVFQCTYENMTFCERMGLWKGVDW